MMPAIVTGAPFNVIARPITPSSPPKRRCQSPWLMTIAVSAFGRS
jgi:hypothetical protein